MLRPQPYSRALRKSACFSGKVGINVHCATDIRVSEKFLTSSGFALPKPWLPISRLQKEYVCHGRKKYIARHSFI